MYIVYGDNIFAHHDSRPYGIGAQRIACKRADEAPARLRSHGPPLLLSLLRALTLIERSIALWKPTKLTSLSESVALFI
jgi:hypothetical protein